MIGIIAAPANLGLRPPEPGAVPGCAKAPEALREAGLHRTLLDHGARDYGVVLPGRYRDDWVAGADRLRNQDAIVEHSRRLAARITKVLDDGNTPLVLGGDCGILVGAGLALRGRHGLVHVDGHTDFRNPGNSTRCASLAGEDLAAAVGRHWDAIADLDGLRPYFDPARTVHIGCRDDDEGLAEATALLHAVIPAKHVRTAPGAVGELTGRYWLHVDVDVLDPAVLPAVDSPDPGGLTAAELTALLTALLPGAIGIQFTVFDPDLDPDGRYATLLASLIGEVLT